MEWEQHMARELKSTSPTTTTMADGLALINERLLTSVSFQTYQWQRLYDLNSTYERLLFVARQSADCIINDDRTTCTGEHLRRESNQTLENLITEIMQRGQETGELTDKMTIEVLVRWFICYYYSVIIHGIDSEYSLHELFEDTLACYYQTITPVT